MTEKTTCRMTTTLNPTGFDQEAIKVTTMSCAWYWEGENGENRVAGSAIVGELALTPAFDFLPHRLELRCILPSQMSMASAKSKVL